MTIIWIIGLILSLLGIYLLKSSRVKPELNYYRGVKTPERPVLKVWSISLLILGALVPILNIVMAIDMVIFWAIHVYDEECWLCNGNSITNKIVQFLNKLIK